MEHNAPLVSIVCDTYNHAPYIRDALDGFLLQKTNFPFEIIVHDDASTDGTADVCRDYAARYPEKIRLIAQTVNRYRTDKKIQTHILFPQIASKYTAICDGDDLWTDPNKLRFQVAYLEAHPDCTLCICGADKIDVNGRVIGAAAPYATDRVVDINDMIRAGGEFCSSNTIVAPTALLNSQPAFCELTEVEDIPVHMWCAVNGYAYYFAKHMAAYRYAVPGSWSARQKRADHRTQIAHCEGVIGLLRGFDAYTNGKYADSYDHAVRYLEFKILCLRHDLKAAKKPPYRQFYDRLGWKRKLRLRLEKAAPNLAEKALALYARARGGKAR